MKKFLTKTHALNFTLTFVKRWWLFSMLHKSRCCIVLYCMYYHQHTSLPSLFNAPSSIHVLLSHSLFSFIHAQDKCHNNHTSAAFSYTCFHNKIIDIQEETVHLQACERGTYWEREMWRERERCGERERERERCGERERERPWVYTLHYIHKSFNIFTNSHSYTIYTSSQLNTKSACIVYP